MNTLFVLLGATAVGKTDVAITIAQSLNCPVISADSRQLYKELRIGTAVPPPDVLQTVRHYFIATRSVTDYYSASMYENEALKLISELHPAYPNLLLCGGSMLYIDAVCNGIDEMPTITDDVRRALRQQFDCEGLDGILAELQRSDPDYFNEVDKKNYRRVIHAVELCRMTGMPYSRLRTHIIKTRPFRIIKLGLERDRQELYERINARVDTMIRDGLVREAQDLYPLRGLNALNTVGYKELFAYFDGACSIDEAIDKIKSNTRCYARKQMTWFHRDPSINWFHPDDTCAMLKLLNTAG
ncbi:MAG: tRNA (adenosine(37)-N6)-dimethylallyltransferase MiaA [Tannerella sp.]|jgi:tRNA dimethylallyltransferase|nr:tRNA (adenosine(37)-N6)-dimethylallyltransferase MiaA [Tannerella sp.]